jgi:SAM-dependent methyltransferase
VREADIRPPDIFREYLRLSAEDARTFFATRAGFIHRACPGCQADHPLPGFEKNGFDLWYCGECGTLYVNPVPAPDRLAAFYRDSPSQRYWASTFFPAVAEARREKIFRPRVTRLVDLLRRHGTDPVTVVDVGAGAGIFLEECRRGGLGRAWRAVEPNIELAGACRTKGFETFEGFAGEAAAAAGWSCAADLGASFEVIEHVADIDEYLRHLAALVRPGGTVVVSGLCGTGFDIAILGKASNAVAPPHHLNFISRGAVSALLRRTGLELVEFLTPGALDIDIVRNTLRDTPPAVADRFLRSLVLDTDGATQAAFQALLAEHGLSSHMWIVARRP